MAVNYKKLFHLLIDKGMTNAKLMEKSGFQCKYRYQIETKQLCCIGQYRKDLLCSRLRC